MSLEDGIDIFIFSHSVNVLSAQLPHVKVAFIGGIDAVLLTVQLEGMTKNIALLRSQRQRTNLYLGHSAI